LRLWGQAIKKGESCGKKRGKAGSGLFEIQGENIAMEKASQLQSPSYGKNFPRGGKGVKRRKSQETYGDAPGTFF